MLILPQFIYRFYAILTNSTVIFIDIDKIIFKFTYNGQRIRIPTTIVKEKNTSRGTILPDFNSYYTATIMKALWY